MEIKKGNDSLFSLRGRVALITGASRGIGLGIAHTYSNAGARVVVCSRSQNGIDKAAEEIKDAGGGVFAVTANVSFDEERKKLIQHAMDWGGRIDILVNNAGSNPAYGSLAELSEAAWDKIFETNLKASFFLSQLVYHNWMKDHGGVILNIASIGAFQTFVGINAYNVTKAALLHLTKCLASEWGRFGIRVNALAPGIIKTHLSEALWNNPIGVEVIKDNPIPRFGDVNDIIGAALFLVADASSFITGQSLVVDGGQLVKFNDFNLVSK